MDELSASSTPDDIAINWRRPTFDFSNTPRYWLDRDPFKTHFMNALSIMIPAVEYIVIIILKKYFQQIPPSKLRDEVQSFIKQEATHASAHTQCNRSLEAIGYSAISRINTLLRKALSATMRVLPTSAQLALPYAFEAFTATISYNFITQQEHWQGNKGKSDNAAVSFASWHALEELEHQSVCSDVYNHVYSQSKGRRIIPFLVIATLIPITIILLYSVQLYLLHKDRIIYKPKYWGRYLKFVFGKGMPLWLILGKPLKVMQKNYDPWLNIDINELQKGLNAFEHSN